MACLDDMTLARFVGGLPATEALAIEAHLADCAACRATLAILAEGEASQPAPASPRALRPGDRVGRYQVEDCIGAGGMGVVYAALDPTLDRKVALKVVRPSATHARLLREAQAMAKLAHPNVVTLHDVIEHGSDIVLAMELVPGATLVDWLRTPRSWRETLDAFLQAGRGLEAAHKANLVHRDFKPANMFVRDDGRVQVGDFGLARAATDESTDDVLASGTPRYMAPEHRAGKPSASSDQFSFCVVLQDALASSSHPAALDLVIERGRAEAASDRFKSMTELLAALEAAARPRRTKTFAVIVAAVLAVGVIGIVLAMRGGDTKPAPTDADRQQAQVLLDTAKSYLARGMPGQAARVASEAVARDPELAIARYYRALALFENGDHDDARTELARVSIAELPERERRLGAALQRRLHGVPLEAEAILRDAAARFPNDPQVRFELGDWAFHVGHLELAETELREAIRLDATFVPAHQHLVWTLDALGRSRDAATAARDWARQVPSRISTIGLVDALCVAGEFDEAIAVLDGAKPSPELDVARADVLIVRGDLPAARRVLEPYATPENPLELQRNTRWSLTWLEGRAGRFSAIERLRDAQRAVANADELEVAALFWKAMRDPEARLPDAPAAQDVITRGPMLHAYIQTAAFDRARALLATDPDPFATLLIDAEQARRQGKLDDALALFQRAARGTRTIRIWAHYGITRCLFALGRWRDVVANELAATSHAFSPRGFHAAVYPQAVLLQARAHEQLGDRARARARYEELARLWNEADPDVRELREVSAALARLAD